MALLVDPLIEAIYGNYETKGKAEPFRPHLGSSGLGNECERAIALNWRWASKGNTEGRVYRLFERGKREEIWLEEDLIAAGIEIVGKQIPIAPFALGHAGGTCDLLAKRFQEAVDKVHVVEGKTMSEWAFKALVAKGLEEAKPIYFAQLQVYMAQLKESHGTERGMFFAINKNNDEYYKERVKLSMTFVKELKKKAERIVTQARIAPNMGGKSHKACKYCSLTEFCYSPESRPEFNCRTCLHSTAIDGGVWHCTNHKKDLSEAEQRLGCESHLFHPDMLPYGDPVEASEEKVTYRDSGGRMVINEKGGIIRRVQS